MSLIKLIMNQVKIGGIFTINRRITMEKVIQNAKRIWNLAISNKKATAVVVVAVIIVVHLITN
jgi:hypothetical protein